MTPIVSRRSSKDIPSGSFRIKNGWDTWTQKGRLINRWQEAIPIANDRLVLHVSHVLKRDEVEIAAANDINVPACLPCCG